MTTVLVTGGAGFIGSHTVDLLLAQNFSVRVLDNFSNGSRNNLPEHHPQLEIIEGDITNSSDVNEAMQGADKCVHLAAQVSVVSSVEDASFSAQQNILGFVNIIEAIRKNHVSRLVYASSAAAYGNPVELPLREDSLLVPESPYGLEKKVNEQYAELFLNLHNMSACGMRYFNVYGPRQDPKSPYAGVIALFVERIKNKQALTIFGDGLQTRDFVFVHDVASINVAALKSDFNGACNVGTGKTVTLLQLIEVLEELCGWQVEKNFGDPREGDIVHSSAIVERMNNYLGFTAQVNLHMGLQSLLDE
ncbi:MAG: NAD-dependent epimerase/dehydratase family protein [Gammaproteobacteria bacterium]|nr:NAD-dependent epimerase/dehydratase family protein [Gammaproteobacteria bacterium]